MKTTTLITVTAAMAVALGLNACSNAEMAQIEQNVGNMQNMERDCKTFVSSKIDLPMAAVSVSPGYGNNGRYTIPVRVKWDEPKVDETGTCYVENGRAVRYKASYE